MRDGRTASLITLPMRVLEASLYGKAGSLLWSAYLRLSKLSSGSPLAEKFRSGFSMARAMGSRLSFPSQSGKSLNGFQFRTVPRKSAPARFGG